MIGMRGEEWSRAWGCSEAQWYSSLYPRLHTFLPAKRILEIGPGYGRWTRYLHEYCVDYTGIDVCEECVKNCIERFAGRSNTNFFKNDGKSLDTASGRFDFVFSFDSLVHADADVMDSYVPAVVSLLAKDGFAFVHHSNFCDSGEVKNSHHRSENVSAAYLRDLVERSGGSVCVQELINWGSTEPIDCITTFRAGAHVAEPALITNRRFMDEANITRMAHTPYASNAIWRN